VGEFDLIRLIRERCAIPREDVRLGIGDDGALLAMPAGQLLVVSTDTLVAGSHFPHDSKAYDIGWKALAVNLSDLAAMGATPAWATLALTLPLFDRQWVMDFADGFGALAREFKLALVGGDTTQGPITAPATLDGYSQPGSTISPPDKTEVDLNGALVRIDGSALGLPPAGQTYDGLTTRNALDLQDGPPGMREMLTERLNRPTPRVAQGLLLRGRATACIDISDGLVADLGHICSASGVGAEVEVDLLPPSSALLSQFDSAARQGFQLAGGDDYELCFTASEPAATALAGDLARSGCGATRIGRIVAPPGVRARDAEGGEVALPRKGWEHFA
jgi:thiamine-monophosphate kinase